MYGFFIVEGEPDGGAVPALWMKAGQEAISPAIVADSLPHRSPEERTDIVQGFLGVATWQVVCTEFSVNVDQLLETVAAKTPCQHLHRQTGSAATCTHEPDGRAIRHSVRVLRCRK